MRKKLLGRHQVNDSVEGSGCSVPPLSAPVQHLHPKQSAHKGEQQEADLMPIKANGNCGEGDKERPVERSLLYNVELFKHALSTGEPWQQSPVQFKLILLLPEILRSDLSTPAWILLSLSPSHSNNSRNS